MTIRGEHVDDEWTHIKRGSYGDLLPRDKKGVGGTLSHDKEGTNLRKEGVRRYNSR